jgi:hypothetical protein
MYLGDILPRWRSDLCGYFLRLRKGDKACIFFGAEQLFILREDATKRRCTMAGDAYIDGLMNGEGFDLKDPEKEACMFTIALKHMTFHAITRMASVLRSKYFVSLEQWRYL